jgi:hypothetical protein
MAALKFVASRAFQQAPAPRGGILGAIVARFPARIMPAGTRKATAIQRGPVGATHFDRAMHAQKIRNPRLANIQEAAHAIRGSATTRRK